MKLHIEIDADWLRKDENEMIAIVKEFGIMFTFNNKIKGMELETRLEETVKGYIATVGQDSVYRDLQIYEDNNQEYII